VSLAAAYGDPRYPQLLRGARWRWWRPVLGLVVAGAVVIATATVVVLIAVGLDALTGGSGDLGDDASLDADRPLGLAATNLVIATLIPAALVAVWAVHRERPGLLASVTGRLRLDLLLRLLPVATGIVAVFFVAGFLVPPVGVGDVDAPGAGTLAGLVVAVLVTTPLQSAAEEVGFRGYLSQAVASFWARPAVGALVAGAVSATLFALAHGSQDPALFADRFAFGVVASWLVWRTGGLEASIALHAANNVVGLLWTSATGSISDTLETSTLDWPLAVLDVAMMATYAAVVARLAQRWGVVARRAPAPLALSGPTDVGYPGSRSSGPPPAGDGPPWGMG
jgi:CAAX protease family protein